MSSSQPPTVLAVIADLLFRSKIDDAALREAQMEKDAVRAYELVYRAMGGE